MTARLEKRVLMEKRRGVLAESGQTLYETEQGRTVHIKILSICDNVGDFFWAIQKKKSAQHCPDRHNFEDTTNL